MQVAAPQWARYNWRVRSPDPASGRRPPAGEPGARYDVAVVGAGPAGRALAGACALRGLRTALVDPDPRRPWRLTYGAWCDELPADLPETAVAARARGRAVALTTRELGWEYAVLDVAGLRAHLDAGLAGVTVVAGRVVHRDGVGVVLADGTTVAALVVVDAGGYRQPLRHPGIVGGSAGTRPAAEQTAYGVVVDEQAAAAVVAPGTAAVHGLAATARRARTPGRGRGRRWPTFLYAVPVGGGRVLLEETSLARRPGLPMPALRDRLLARLARYAITPSPDAEVERVHFPVDTGPPPRAGRRRVRCGGAAHAPGHRVQRRRGAPPGPDRRRRARRAPAPGSAGRSRGGTRGRLVTRRAGRAPAAPARPGGAAADASRGGARLLRGVLRAAGSRTAGPTSPAATTSPRPWPP